MQKNTHTRTVISKVAIFAIILITAADITFKYLANKWLPEYGSHSVFDIFLFKNTGIAFSLPVPIEITIITSLLLIILLIFFAIRHKNLSAWQSIGALSIILGASNNLIDRLINGYTTDYLIFFQRSAINLADILILFGVLLILYYSENRNK